MTEERTRHDAGLARWHCIKMSPADITVGKHIRLLNAFEAVFLATLASGDVAMFGNRTPDQDYTYWFSPRASELFAIVLSAVGASDCFAPPQESVMLLVGNRSAVELLSHK